MITNQNPERRSHGGGFTNEAKIGAQQVGIVEDCGDVVRVRTETPKTPAALQSFDQRTL